MIARNASLLLAGRLATAAIGLLTMGVATRALGPAEFGRFEFALAFVGYFLFVTDLGVCQVLIRRLASGGLESSRWFGAGLGLRLALAALIFPFPCLAAVFLGLPPNLIAALGVASLILFPAAFDTVGTLLVAHGRFGRLSLAGVLQSLAGLGFALYGAYADWDAVAWLGGAVGAATFGSTLLTWFGADVLPVRPRWDPAAWRDLLGEGCWIGFSFGIFALTWRIDVLLLERLTGSLATVGQYGLAYRFVDLGAAASGILVTASLPVFSRLNLESPARFSSRSARAAWGAGGLGLGLALCFTGGGGLLALLGGGSAFEAAASYLRVLGWVFPFYFAEAMWGTALIAAERARWNVVGNLVGLVTNFALNLYAIPRWGALGAAGATVLSQALEASVYAYLYHRWITKETRNGE